MSQFAVPYKPGNVMHPGFRHRILCTL